MRAGVDVGGTNTDAVLLRGDQVLAAFKWPTAADVTSGIIAPRAQRWTNSALGE